ncbi:MAG TPA: DUF167 domain-containing protein [Bacteroidia bacterium]|nr:DUF167 domain-containing protein [Bacteroidia bacterium]
MIKLLIKVKPGSGKDELFIDNENNISVKIKAKPIDGEANDYLVKYLSDKFQLSKALIQIDKGATSRLKRISINIDQVQFDEILRKLNPTI